MYWLRKAGDSEMGLNPAPVLGILIDTLDSAAVGMKREWSGLGSGPTARFAGIRIFTLLEARSEGRRLVVDRRRTWACSRTFGWYCSADRNRVRRGE